MIRACRRVLVSVLALLVSACASQVGVSTEPLQWPNPCIADAAERVANVNWLEAETIDLRVRQGEFTPVLIRLKKDSPYVLRIANGDDGKRVFRSNEFFAAIALAKVIMGETEFTKPCISAVTIAPRETAAVQFVAVRDGRYEFEDFPFLLPRSFPVSEAASFRSSKIRSR